jgi:hypothetical protein
VFDFLFRRTKRRRAAWASVAEELGGSFHLAKGIFRRKNERIEVVVDGVPVVLDFYVVSTGKSSQSFTRVAAPFARGPGPKMRVYRKGVLASIGKAIGTQDVELGIDAAFDEAFMVKSDEEAVARRLWSASTSSRMLAMFASARFESNDAGLKLVEGGVWDQPERLRTGIRLVAELAGRDLFGVDALARIDGAHVVQQPGGRPRAELDVPVRIVVGAEDVDGHLVMFARADERIAIDPVELAIVDGKPSDPARAGALPQGASVPMRAVGTGTLIVDGDGLRFRWRDLELDPIKLRAGAELIGAIAAGQAGVYR